LAFAGFFNIYFREFILHGREILPLIVGLLGMGGLIETGWVAPNLATFKGVVPLITVAGAIVSFFLLKEIVEQFDISRFTYRLHQLIMTFTTLVFLMML
jgi:hypothetical protein